MQVLSWFCGASRAVGAWAGSRVVCVCVRQTNACLENAGDAMNRSFVSWGFKGFRAEGADNRRVPKLLKVTCPALSANFCLDQRSSSGIKHSVHEEFTCSLTRFLQEHKNALRV